MPNVCTPILVGVTSLVLEILLPSKTANFPFPTMDYSLWSSKILIDRNQLKKFMQVGIDVKCMLTNFGLCDLFSFRDFAPFLHVCVCVCLNTLSVYIHVHVSLLFLFLF